MRPPAEFARTAEDSPVLPPGDCERVSGYGVMGLPFASGHVLGLRRWTASSVGDRFTSIWHRSPDGRWTFYESVPSDIACTRYFGDDVETVQVGPIDVAWEAPDRLHVRTVGTEGGTGDEVDDCGVDWTIDIGSTLRTRMMSSMGSLMPLAAWRSRPVLGVMGAMAGRVLGVGRVQLTGTTSNRQHFDANPLRIWYVTDSRATVAGDDLGPVGALSEQARMADFYFPQRGIFAMGRVFITPKDDGEPSVAPDRPSGALADR